MIHRLNCHNPYSTYNALKSQDLGQITRQYASEISRVPAMALAKETTQSARVWLTPSDIIVTLFVNSLAGTLSAGSPQKYPNANSAVQHNA